MVEKKRGGKKAGAPAVNCQSRKKKLIDWRSLQGGGKEGKKKKSPVANKRGWRQGRNPTRGKKTGKGKKKSQRRR